MWTVVAVYVLVLRPRFDPSVIQVRAWIWPVSFTVATAIRWVWDRVRVG